MPHITERAQSKRLKDLGIDIHAKYKDNSGIVERKTEIKQNPNVYQGVLLEKIYYQNHLPIGKTTGFDPRMQYTFIASQEEKEMSCPNCGFPAPISDFLDGCPYCGTDYNIDYTNKDLGAKYHYDKVVHSNYYIWITLIIDLLFSLLFMLCYILLTGRTFNSYDILKVLIGGIVFGVATFYLFYTVDAFIVVLPVRWYKEKQNQKQIAFWQRMETLGISKTTFFNNFNYELQEYLYSDKNEQIIDYDIVDYLAFQERKKDNKLFIQVEVRIRLVKWVNQKLVTETSKKTVILEKNNQDTPTLNNGINIIACRNCGSSIDVTKGVCEYCQTKYNYLQEWYLTDFRE